MGLRSWFNNRFVAPVVAEQVEAVQAEALVALDRIKAQVGFSFQLAGTNGEKWLNGLPNTGVGMAFNHLGLRRNARRAYFESPQCKAIVDRFADSVADVGLILEATPKAELLGITEEQAAIWGARVESMFDSWARDKGQHRSEQMTFYQSHRLYAIQQQRDSDMFIRLYYSPAQSLLNPLQWEIIDPDQIAGDTVTSTAGSVQPTTATFLSGNRDGITRDDRGRELSYRVWIRKPDGTSESVEIMASGPKSGRKFMLHGWTPEYPGQTRGYSRISHALQEFSSLTDYTAAHIKKAINQAMWAVQNVNKQMTPSNPMEALLNLGDGEAGPAGITDPNQPTETESSLDPRISYQSAPQAEFLTPDSFAGFALRQGDEIRTIDSSAPGSTYDAFVTSFTSYLAASVGEPIEVVLMKFNNNYSASRATLILFWRVCQIWQGEMASDYLNPVYEMWLCEEIAAGRISCPGWSDPRSRAAWLHCNWIGAPMPNIDPARTQKADQGYAEMGATTLDRIARNLNGSSGAANRAAITREFKAIPESPFQPKPAAVAQAPVPVKKQGGKTQ